MAVRYERRGAAAVLTIDRPHARNAVDREAAEALRDGYHAFEADAGARALVVTGAGGEAFCGGADLKAMNNPANASEGPMGFTRLHASKPTIAAIEGWCVAGGLEIACWCDVRIAGEGARFGVLNRRWGVPLIDGGTQRLPRIVGLGRALDMILTGRIVEHDEALHTGLISRLVPRGTALDAALVVAEQIAAFPQECLLADRHCVYDGLGTPLSDGLKMEADIGRSVIGLAQSGAARFASGEGRHAAGV
ncbi:MAG: crotonase/enoyl-CoA hydratase family protein [Dehalococcoidia bacterium]|nr:crotonase/enoyl-CoA hydratase family protein [Dehalococcoidia bacterium]